MKPDSTIPPVLPIRLAIVEDDADFRTALQNCINETQIWSCVAACPTAKAALEQLPNLRPDIVLIDIRLRDTPGKPDQSGLDLLPQLKAQIPNAKLVMLTVVDDDNEMLQAIQQGAWSYILKGGTRTELLSQIAVIANGGSFMSATIAQRLLHWFQTHATECAQGFRLTEREWQLLELRAQGKTRQEIATALGTSPNTVRNQFSVIFSKFGIRDAASIIYQVGPTLRIRETIRSKISPGHNDLDR